VNTLTEKEAILWVFEQEMVSKIYGFCHAKLNTVEDAEDLSQDIKVEYLVENQLMIETSKGKYQTDFVILPGNNPTPANKIYATVFPAYYEKLMAFLELKKEILMGAGFNTAGFTWERLLWVYIHIISDMAVNTYRYENNVSVKYEDIPMRPNGGKWIALGLEGGYGLDEKLK
jgi:hypothetical protein